MIRIKHDDSLAHAGGKGYLFTEGDVQTRIGIHNGLDFIIQQREGKGKWNTFTTYSNPGMGPFACILRFLYMHGYSLPRFPRDSTKIYDFSWEGQVSGMIATNDAFPSNFSAELGQPMVTAKLIHENGKPSLEFQRKGMIVRITPSLAKALIHYIPKSYAKMGMFPYRSLVGNFIREVRRKGFESQFKSIPEVRGKQRNVRGSPRTKQVFKRRKPN